MNNLKHLYPDNPSDCTSDPDPEPRDQDEDEWPSDQDLLEHEESYRFMRSE